MRKSLIVAALLLVALAGFTFFRSGKEEKKLRICTWSQYLPDAFIKKFTDTTGVQVEVSLISSNEELFAKIRAGATGYDIIQPSDYLVERLIRLSDLQPLDKNLLTNLSHLSPEYQTVPYDPGLQYSLPFTQGSTGIIINTEKFPIAPEDVSWSLVFESPDPLHTSLLDDMRETFAAALFWKGRQPNDLSEENVTLARDIIAKAKKQIASFTSEPLALLQRSEVSVAHAFSYQGIEANKQDPNLVFVLPKEGAVNWVDTMAILKTSTQPALAHQFMNFLLDPQNALYLNSLNGLPSPNKTANVTLAEQKALFTPKGTPASQAFLHDLHGDTLERIGRAWTELKAQ